MHIFSVILIAVTLLNYFVNRSRKKIFLVQTAITIFICTFVNVGYFFESDVINVNYDQAAILIEFVTAILCGNNSAKVSKKFFAYTSALFVSSILLFAIPSTTANVVGAGGRFELYMTGQLPFLRPEFSKFTVFFFVLAVCLAYAADVMKKTFSDSDWEYLLVYLAKMGKGLMIIVCAEAFIKYILATNAYSSFIIAVFGKGTSTYLTLVSRGSFKLLQGLTREGSHFTYGMMLMIVLFFTEAKVCNRSNKKWIILSAGALFTSGAFSMVLCGAGLVGFYFIYLVYYNTNGKAVAKKLAKRIIFVIGIAGISLAAGGIIIQSNSYLSSRFVEALEIVGALDSRGVAYYASLSHVTSNQSRLFSAYFTFKEFLKRPLFGLGLGTTFCYSGTTLMFAEIGIVGVIMYWKFLMCIGKKWLMNDMPMKLSLLLWFVCNLLMGIQSMLVMAADVFIIIGCSIVLFKSQNQSITERR